MARASPPSDKKQRHSCRFFPSATGSGKNLNPKAANPAPPLRQRDK
jgi:hypothetical protein